MRNILIAIDPGETSGVAVATYHGDRAFDIIRIYEIAWADRFDLYWLLSDYRSTTLAIIVENFRLFNNPITIKSQINSEFPSAKMIGILELSAHLLNLTDRLYVQQPSDIHSKGKATIDILPEHRIHVRGSVHKLDSLLHLTYFVLLHRRKLKPL